MKQFLSTPSGWRATLDKIYEHVLSDEQISIHALRVEGDAVLDRNNYVFFVFLSTPSGWRATGDAYIQKRCARHFYPRPPGGGRRTI